MPKSNTRVLLIGLAVLFAIYTSAWILNITFFAPKTTQTPQEAETIARLCQNLEYGEEDIPLPITCTLPIHKEQTAEFTFQADGGLLVQQGGRVLFKLAFDPENPIEGPVSELVLDLHKPTLRPDGFVLQDITFDGYADLQIMTVAGAYNFGYDFYAYNPQTRTFGPKPLLKDMVNPTIDIEQKQILYFSRGRGLSDTFFAGTYQFINGIYILVETVEQNMIGDYDDEDGLYERITSKLRNGEMVVIKKETLTAKEVWGE